MYKTLKALVKTVKSQNPVPSGSGVIHTNNPKLGTVIEEHIHVPLSNQIYGKLLLPPVERIRIILSFISKDCVAQETNPHHPVQVYPPEPRLDTPGQISLAPSWNPWEHPELGTSNLQHTPVYSLQRWPAHL